jgi:hypothetical protein
MGRWNEWAGVFSAQGGAMTASAMRLVYGFGCMPFTLIVRTCMYMHVEACTCTKYSNLHRF